VINNLHWRLRNCCFGCAYFNNDASAMLFFLQSHWGASVQLSPIANPHDILERFPSLQVVEDKLPCSIGLSGDPLYLACGTEANEHDPMLWNALAFTLDNATDTPTFSGCKR
jgi:hypothetical protein